MIKELEQLLKRQKEQIWTLAPGIIKEVDYAKLTAKVQLKAKVKNQEGKYIEIPELEEVPIMVMKGGDSIIITAPKKDDIVVVLFSYYPLSGLLKDKSTRDVNYERRQDISDAIILPGLFVTSDTFPTIAEDETLIFHKSKNYAKFDKDGNLKISDEGGTNQVEIKFSDGKINIKSATEVNINEGTAGAARVGDPVSVSLTTGDGTITEGSMKTKIG